MFNVFAGMNHSIALVWVEALLQYTVDVGPDVVLHTLFMSAECTVQHLRELVIP